MASNDRATCTVQRSACRGWASCLPFRHARPDYPPPNASPLVDTLHGHPVADPYRWLEDAEDPRTVAWSKAQDALFAAGARHLAGQGARATPGLRAGRGWRRSRVPVWRGDRQFLMRRTAEQEHAVLLVVEADGTERILIDPMAHRRVRHHDARHLAAEQGRSSARVPALRGRHRGVGAARHGRHDRRDRRRPDRPGPLLPGGLAARRRVLLLRATASGRPGARRRGAVPPPGLAAPRRHGPRHRHPRSSATAWTPPTTTASASAATVGGCPSPRPPAPSRATTSGSPTSRRRRRDKPELVTVQEGVDAQTSLHFGRDGLIYAYTERGRTARPHPGERARRLGASTQWRELVPEDAEAVLEGWAVLDGDELPDPVLLVVRSSHAVGHIHRHELRTGSRDRIGPDARARHGRRDQRPPRGWARGLVRLHRPHDAGVGVPLRRPHRRRPRSGPAHRARSTSRR